MVLYLDEANLVGRQSALLGEESHDVALAYLLLFAGGKVQGRHRRRLQPVGLGVEAEVGCLGGILGQLFGGAHNQEGLPLGVHAGGASVAVGEALEVDGQVVVDDILHLGDVESAGGQVGRDADVAAVVAEFTESPFAVGLLHAAVKRFGNDTPVGEELLHPLHALALVAEDERKPRLQVAQQEQQRVELVLHG